MPADSFFEVNPPLHRLNYRFTSSKRIQIDRQTGLQQQDRQVEVIDIAWIARPCTPATIDLDSAMAKVHC